MDLMKKIEFNRSKMESFPIYSTQWYALHFSLAKLVREWRVENTLRSVK